MIYPNLVPVIVISVPPPVPPRFGFTLVIVAVSDPW